MSGYILTPVRQPTRMRTTPTPPPVARPRPAPPAVAPPAVSVMPAVSAVPTVVLQPVARRGSEHTGLALTTRQLTILAQMAQGLSGKEIGYRLEVSDMTIKTHKANIADRLGSNGSSAHAVAMGYARGYLQAGPDAWYRLTPRMREMLPYLAAGMGDGEIATRLHLSGHTVKTHLARLFERLGAAGRANAVHLALHSGMIRVVLREAA